MKPSSFIKTSITGLAMVSLVVACGKGKDRDASNAASSSDTSQVNSALKAVYGDQYDYNAPENMALAAKIEGVSLTTVDQSSSNGATISSVGSSEASKAQLRTGGNRSVRPPNGTSGSATPNGNANSGNSSVRVQVAPGQASASGVRPAATVVVPVSNRNPIQAKAGKEISFGATVNMLLAQMPVGFGFTGELKKTQDSTPLANSNNYCQIPNLNSPVGVEATCVDEKCQVAIVMMRELIDAKGPAELKNFRQAAVIYKKIKIPADTANNTPESEAYRIFWSAPAKKGEAKGKILTAEEVVLVRDEKAKKENNQKMLQANVCQTFSESLSAAPNGPGAQPPAPNQTEAEKQAAAKKADEQKAAEAQKAADEKKATEEKLARAEAAKLAAQNGTTPAATQGSPAADGEQRAAPTAADGPVAP